MVFAIGILVTGFLGFGAGYLVGSGDGGTRAAPTLSPTISAAPTSAATAPQAPTGSPSAGPDSALLIDGRYFVEASEVLDGPPATLAFDLAYFLRGREAAQAAADHGDVLETDYYIVNDDPLLRRLPVSPLVQVTYVSEGACCSLQPGRFEPWAAAVNDEIPNDYAGKDAVWWITVSGGEIVRIEEQFLP